MTDTSTPDRRARRRGPARPAPLAGPGRHRRRPADDRAGRVDREHRAAVGPEGPRHQRRRPAVGRHGLHAGLRRPAAARRPDRRLRRPQAHLPHRARRLRRRVARSAASRAPPALLFAARALQGAFAALLAPAALSLITVTFTEPKERARAFGVFGAISGGGAAIGLILGGVLTEYASWRWCLGVNVPIALAAAAAAVAVVHESKAPGEHRYDVPGAVLVTAGLVSLVYGFTEAAKQKNPGRSTEVLGWTSASTLGFLGRGRRAAGRRSCCGSGARPSPLLPLRIALDRNRGGSYLMFLLVGAGLFAMFLFLTYYFQITLGYSPLKSGFAFLPFSGGIIVTAGVVAQLLPRVGPKPLMVPGLAAARLGMLLLTRICADDRRTGRTSCRASCCMSIGMACVFIPASSTALDRRRLARRRRGQRAAQHLAAGRRLARHGAAQHAVRRRRHQLRRRPTCATRRTRSGSPGWASCTATTWRSSGAPCCCSPPCSSRLRHQRQARRAAAGRGRGARRLTSAPARQRAADQQVRGARGAGSRSGEVEDDPAADPALRRAAGARRRPARPAAPGPRAG